MKILVVDDDGTKSKMVEDVIGQALGASRPFSVTSVMTLADAVRILSQVAFDLVVLDLMLPYLTGGIPDGRAGLELLRQMRTDDGLNKAATVIALSAFPDEVAISRHKFDQFGVVVIEFDHDGAWNGPLRRVVAEVSARSSTHIDLDFIVICALEEEREGFDQSLLEKVSQSVVSGLNVHYYRSCGTPELFGGIIRLSHPGLVAATFETSVALNIFRPKILCMSGICAGFSKETTLGQLVVASPAWEYQAGKWSKNGFEIAPMQVPLRPGTRTAIDQAISDDKFVRQLEADMNGELTRPPRIAKPILAPFATGSAVIADERRLTHIEKQHRKVAALDMESFGVYFAAHEAASSLQHFFSMKCVVDLADTGKNDDLHRYGCVVSARATAQILRVLMPS